MQNLARGQENHTMEHSQVMLLRALLFVPVFLWMRSPDVADPLKLLAMSSAIDDREARWKAGEKASKAPFTSNRACKSFSLIRAAHPQSPSNR